jgi:biopolymer transport protein ExbB
MMMQLWTDVGFIRWPLTFSGMAVIGLALMSASTLFGRDATAGLVAKTWIDAILFWGGFAVISGVLGSIIGVIVGFQAIEAAGEVEATLVAGGIKVALLSSLFGVTILAFAALLWFALQFRWRVLQANEFDAAI